MVKLIVAGTGLIGHRHMQHIAEHPDLELAGIIDPDPARRQHPNVPGFATVDDVDLAVDGIVIATPTDTHLPLAYAAAARGWHMLVEKPLADSIENADKIIYAAGSANVQLLVGHHRRHHPRVAALKCLTNDPRLGKPVVAQLLWCMKKPDAYFDTQWRAGINGAPVRQNLIHDVDILRWLFGDILEIGGMGSNAVRKTNRTESGGAILRFSTGVIATISFADTTPTPWGFEAGTAENPTIAYTGEDCLRISCTNGAIEFPSLRIWTSADNWHEAPMPTTIHVDDCKPLIKQLEHFADVINGITEPLVTGADGRAALDAILKIETATAPAD